MGKKKKGMGILTTTPKENMSDGLFTGPDAWASGLRHIQFPACFPTMSQLGGTWAESSKSASWTCSTAAPSVCFRSTNMLFGLISMKC